MIYQFPIEVKCKRVCGITQVRKLCVYRTLKFLSAVLITYDFLFNLVFSLAGSKKLYKFAYTSSKAGSLNFYVDYGDSTILRIFWHPALTALIWKNICLSQQKQIVYEENNLPNIPTELQLINKISSLRRSSLLFTSHNLQSVSITFHFNTLVQVINTLIFNLPIKERCSVKRRLHPN